MTKYIIKNCPCFNNENFSRNFYEPNDTFCTYKRKNCQDCICILKNIYENLCQVALAGHCDNCDGCGYENGCSDTECGTYQANKCLELLKVKGWNNEQ